MKKNIFAIIGSASRNSSNLKLVILIAEQTKKVFDFTIFDRLSELPHFNPESSIGQTPAAVLEFRDRIAGADAVLICTPEYVFSIPSGLKNAIEWCVATTVFSKKPVGLITASASGQKGHEELLLIMRTIEAKFTADTQLLIRGIKGKVSEEGNISDAQTQVEIERFIDAFTNLVFAEPVAEP